MTSPEQKLAKLFHKYRNCPVSLSKALLNNGVIDVKTISSLPDIVVESKPDTPKDVLRNLNQDTSIKMLAEFSQVRDNLINELKRAEVKEDYELAAFLRESINECDSTK